MARYMGSLLGRKICSQQPEKMPIKGIVHLNIIFSYMKFNKICNLDYPIF